MKPVHFRLRYYEQAIKQLYHLDFEILISIDEFLKSEAVAIKEDWEFYQIIFKDKFASDEVIIHELAHVLCWVLHCTKDHGHGAEWTAIYEQLEDLFLCKSK